MTPLPSDRDTGSTLAETDPFTEAPTDNSLVDVIQTVIASLAQDQTAMVHHSDGGSVWKFKYGTVEVFVQLTGLLEDDMLTVWAAVLPLPARDEARLMRHLLEMNWSGTLEARFGIVNDQVVVVSSRSLADLSPTEISRAITIVATLADDNDEPLQEQFGAN
jgi:hypothetical protein